MYKLCFITTWIFYFYSFLSRWPSLFSGDLSSFVPSLNLSNFQKDHQRENLRNCNISSDALYAGDVISAGSGVLGNWIFLICHPLHRMTVSPLDSRCKALTHSWLSHSCSLSPDDSLVTARVTRGQWRRHGTPRGAIRPPTESVTQLPGNTGLGPEIKEKPSLKMNRRTVPINLLVL